MTTESGAPVALRPTAERSFATHAIETLRLAGPVVVSRSGSLILVTIDTAMTGRAGADQLAYLGLSLALQIVVTIVGIGLLVGTAVLVAQADGAGEKAKCGSIWRVSLWHALVLGLAGAAVCLAGGPFFLAIGQHPALAQGAGDVLVMSAWGMPPMLLAVSTSFLLEGIRRPKAGMVVALIAIVVNTGLNWIFIYGNLGAPAMGAEGAILATSLVRCLMAVLLFAYVYMMPGGEAYGIRGPIQDAGEHGRRLRALGVPLGIAYFIEVSANMTLVVLAGYLGTVALGAYQIAQNLIALTFMVALGVAMATAVRVANAVGRRDAANMRLAGRTGVVLITTFMVPAAVLFYVMPEGLTRLYTNDTGILAETAGFMPIVALLLVFNGIQGVRMGALRGAGDVWIPALLQFGAYWAVAVPAGAYLAFVAGQGPGGLMLGLGGGVALASVALTLRFRSITRRGLARI